MELSSPHYPSRRFPSPADIEEAFQHVDRAARKDHPFLVLEDVSDFCSGYIQALRQMSGYWVEVRHGQTGRHYRTLRPVPREGAVALFVQFLQSGTAVLDANDWRDVTESVRRETDRPN